MSIVPAFSSATIPALPLLSLSDTERDLVARLQSDLLRREYKMRVSEAYYLGNQAIQNLRIAVPKELEFLKTRVGWASLAVDPYVERLSIDGLRLPNATDADADLGDLLAETEIDAQFPLAATDALSIGRGYWLVGTGEDVPLVTVESPLNMSVSWDLTGTKPQAALQSYWLDGRRHAALYLPNRTVQVATDDSGVWQLVDRDEHDYGFVPVVRMPHQPRTNARDGRSAITPAIRSTVDSACRDLLGLEVSREIYSVPSIAILGATEADFQKSDGTAKSAWETYITRVKALERDEEGNVPTLWQQTPYDPSAFTKLIDMRASQMASMVAAPPQDLGLYTSGNPVSADAVGAMETRRNQRAKLMQKTFGRSMAQVVQTVLRFQNGGSLPAEFRRIEVDWADVDEVSLGLASDAISKQISAGAVPATSDVVLKRLGYSAVERQRLAQDREAEAGDTAAQQIIDALKGPQQQPQGVDGGNADNGQPVG